MKASTVPPEEDAQARTGVGSQTLLRGLDVLEAIAGDRLMLPELSQKLGLTKSTTYRLASALVERGYLSFTPGAGYRLGAKLLELGHVAQSDIDVVQVARTHIEALAARTEDTVHLGAPDGDEVYYLDKIPGRRRITIRSRVGDRHPLTSTGLGKALMLDRDADFWQARFAADGNRTAAYATWATRMEKYVAAGRAYDLEENEDQVRCVAAPIRDAGGGIVAAISVSSAAQYMSDARMEALSADVRDTADAISRDLGWTPAPHP